MGAWGYSAGAHLVTLMAFEDSPPADRTGTMSSGGGISRGSPSAAATKLALPLRAVIAGGTPVDFRQYPLDSRTLAFWLGGSRREKPQVYDAASPGGVCFRGGSAGLLLSWRLRRVGADCSGQVLDESTPDVERSHGDVCRARRRPYPRVFDATALDRATAFLDKWLKL